MDETGSRKGTRETIAVTILGCGGAGGVPMINAGWGRCDPNNPKNRRRRASVLVEAWTKGQETPTTRVLVDTSPDLREQLLDAGVKRLDGVVYTHAHADHIHGIDDLREINRAIKGPLALWADRETMDQIEHRFGYVLTPIPDESSAIYKPVLMPNLIEGPFTVGALDVTPFRQDHGWSTTLGLRFGPVAYSTDVVALDEEAFAALDGVDVWIVGCLVDTPHPTHAHVGKVLAWCERVRPRRCILTHMSPRLDYETLRRTLPEGVEPAYDGMVIEAVRA